MVEIFVFVASLSVPDGRALSNQVCEAGVATSVIAPAAPTFGANLTSAVACEIINLK